MFYIIIFIICLAVLSIGNCSKTDMLKKSSYFICWVILFLFSSLRYKIGTDYVNYLELYNLVNTSHFQDLRIEPFYFFLMRGINVLGFDPHYLFIVSSLLTISVFFLSFGKQNYFFAVVGFVLILMLPSFSLMRQALAVSFLVLSSQLIITSKPWQSILACVLAILCHYSAIFFLPLMIAGKYPFSRKQAFAILGFLIIAVYVFQLPRLLLDSSLLSRTVYGVYAGGSYDFKTAVGSGVGVLLRNLTPCFVVLFLYRVKSTHKKFSEDRLCRYLVVFNMAYLFATIMALQIHIFNRFSDLLLFVPILNLVYLPNLIQNKKTRFLIMYSMLAIYFVLFIADIYNNPSSRGTGLGIYPYRSIFHLSD